MPKQSETRAMPRLLAAAAALLLCNAMPSAAQSEAMVVGGLRPHERPADAPVMRASDRARSDSRQMKGVAEPYPRSLRFVADHGGWFTPFTEPGMTGRYDLRGYHGQRNPQPDVAGAGGQ